MQTYLLYIVKFVKNIYMTWIPNIITIAKSVLSLVLQALPVGRSYSISCYQTVRSIIGCLSQRFSKNVFLEPKCRICQLTRLQLWNCFSYYPSIINFNFLSGQRGTFFRKRQKRIPRHLLIHCGLGTP
jgi:hypothetical protein